MPALSELPHARLERLRFVESLLLWEGLVQRQQVCDVFGVSANHVTKDLRFYEEAHPGNIHFQARLRGYVPMPRFKPAYASDDPSQYLRLLQAQTESGSEALAALIGATALSSAALPSPGHAVDKAVLRCVVQAIRKGCGVDVAYLSMSSDQATQRTLWPHALFHAGDRWYVRAFDSQRNQFRDFALQRITHPNINQVRCPVRTVDDADWHALEILEVVPHPKLSAHQRQIVAREYGMSAENGTFLWKVELRRCLVAYFARHHDLDQQHPDPASYRIVLRNRGRLKAYFMNGKAR